MRVMPRLDQFWQQHLKNMDFMKSRAQCLAPAKSQRNDTPNLNASSESSSRIRIPAAVQ